MTRDALHVVDDLALDRGTGRTDAARIAIAVFERGWHAQLDRAQLNRLIRTLRRARDAAYGADA